MDSQLEKLKQYQERPIVVVCANGQTSPQEGNKLKHKGFENVSFLSGGIAAWKEEGLPLTKG
jgi:rhodanese-related sulfurtransferase